LAYSRPSEPDYNESLKKVLEADRCVRMVPAEHGMSHLSVLATISKLAPTSRIPPEPVHELGQERPVAYRHFDGTITAPGGKVLLKGRAVGKSTELGELYLSSVKQESDDVVQVEEVDVQYERLTGVTEDGDLEFSDEERGEHDAQMLYPEDYGQEEDDGES
jgi:hypothetical protein